LRPRRRSRSGWAGSPRGSRATTPPNEQLQKRRRALIHIHHVNLQIIAGGGEIYTRSLTRALLDCGARVTLYVHPANRLWDDLPVDRVTAEDESELAARLPARGATLLVHTKLSEKTAKELSGNHFLAGYAHLPMHQREPGWLSHCALVLTVSSYSIDLLRRASVERLYPEPMYGTADIARGDPAAPVLAKSPYLWDRRKARDRLLGSLQPLFGISTEAQYVKRPGLTLGIVSFIMPIKQFPLLFSSIAPILARHEVNLEIFGAGGFAQVRDLKRELAPLGARVRFWGHQENVAAVFPRIDYLLTGLPENEALGLNVLEAQMCGTPVLAPKAPPFTETVLDGQTGYLYRDPREDNGAAFELLIKTVKEKKFRLDPRLATDHLKRFSYPALVERTRHLLDHLQTRMPA
jgi:glycosyltransferase involved in cell wall biosynthesis